MEEKLMQEKHPEDDKMARLRNAGVNTWSGMQYCSGDMGFYGELLTRFAREKVRKAAEMDDCFHREALIKKSERR